MTKHFFAVWVSQEHIWSAFLVLLVFLGTLAGQLFGHLSSGTLETPPAKPWLEMPNEVAGRALHLCMDFTRTWQDPPEETDLDDAERQNGMI